MGGFQADNVLLAAGLVMACGVAPADVFDTLDHLDNRAGPDATGRDPGQWRGGVRGFRPHARRDRDGAQCDAPACHGPSCRHRWALAATVIPPNVL